VKKLLYFKLGAGLSIFIITSLIISLFFTACNNPKETGPSGKRQRISKIPVEVVVVKTGLLINEIFTTGSLLANEKVELRNEIPGRVMNIYFEEGKDVTKGELLLKINDSDLRAQLSKNEAQEKLAEQEEFRKRTLLELKAISQEEYDISLNQLKTLQAERDLILAQIEKTEIYAPFSGKIGLRYISPGSYLVSNSLIAILQQTNPIKVEFAVPEKYSRIIHPGMTINYTVENFSQTFSGEIYAIESEIDPHTRTISARALSPNLNSHLLPGKFARIKIVLERIPDAIVIPSEAISTELSGSSLYLCKNNKASYIQVTPGIRTSSGIEIIEGLHEKNNLITTGLLQISEGTPVEPKPAAKLVVSDIE
jgi:membrane fusion protein, multidrug efflux system